VTITGTPLIGQTLTVDISQLGGSGALSYQWQRAAGGLGWVSVTYTNIAGATAKPTRWLTRMWTPISE